MLLDSILGKLSFCRPIRIIIKTDTNDDEEQEQQQQHDDDASNDNNPPTRGYLLLEGTTTTTIRKFLHVSGVIRYELIQYVGG